jgi:hypothetical protein
VALERLQQRIPVCWHFWFLQNPMWDTLLKCHPNKTLLWAKD